MYVTQRVAFLQDQKIPINCKPRYTEFIRQILHGILTAQIQNFNDSHLDGMNRLEKGKKSRFKDFPQPEQEHTDSFKLVIKESHESDDGAEPEISLAQRALPLLQLLQNALKEKAMVTWGV